MTTTSLLLTALTVVVALTVGVLAGRRLGAAETTAQLGRRNAALEAEAAMLRERVFALEASTEHDRELAATLAPLAGSLSRVESQVHALERDRVEQYSRLGEQLLAVQTGNQALQAQTASLAGALRSSTSRGSWGEVQLRRVVEHAGMLPRVDFTTQAQGTTPDGRAVRPDLLVHLPGGKQIVVDAKAPLAAFLHASEAGGQESAAAATAHAQALKAHVDTLAAKEYWTAFDPTPQLVVCFLPGEAFLATACAADPALLEYAMARRVVLATPTTLMALLRTVAITWQSETLTGNARELLTLGRELHQRLAGLGGHADRLGRDLSRAVEGYNALIGTLERRVLVSARRLRDLDLADEVLAEPTPIDIAPRPLTSEELIAGRTGYPFEVA